MLDMKTTDSANPIELPQLSYRYCTIYDQIPLIRSWLMMELIWIQLLFLSSACCFPGPHHIFQVFTWTNQTPKVEGRSHINLQYSSTHQLMRRESSTKWTLVRSPSNEQPHLVAARSVTGKSSCVAPSLLEKQKQHQSHWEQKLYMNGGKNTWLAQYGKTT